MTSVGLCYLEFIILFASPESDQRAVAQAFDALFAPTVHKVVNSVTVATNRSEVLAQMTSVREEEQGLGGLELLEEYATTNPHVTLIRWEITYGDGRTESVVTVLRTNDAGQLVEIIDTYGEKACYQFPRG